MTILQKWISNRATSVTLTQTVAAMSPLPVRAIIVLVTGDCSDELIIKHDMVDLLALVIVTHDVMVVALTLVLAKPKVQIEGRPTCTMKMQRYMQPN